MNKFYESIKKMLETGKAGKLGAMDDYGDCIYADGYGKFCAIGSLMPAEAIEAIANNEYQESSLGDLGRSKIFKVKDYGLTLEQGERLQYWHDRAFDGKSTLYGPEDFLEVLEGILSKEVTELAYHPFGDYSRRVSLLPAERS